MVDVQKLVRSCWLLLATRAKVWFSGRSLKYVNPTDHLMEILYWKSENSQHIFWPGNEARALHPYIESVCATDGTAFYIYNTSALQGMAASGIISIHGAVSKVSMICSFLLFVSHLLVDILSHDLSLANLAINLIIIICVHYVFFLKHINNEYNATTVEFRLPQWLLLSTGLKLEGLFATILSFMILVTSGGHSHGTGIWYSLAVLSYTYTLHVHKIQLCRLKALEWYW